MASTAAATHKVANGDTLDAIAKKYRSTPKAIWAFAENKALVSKRGKPEAIQPGDVIAIPPDEKAAKERDKKLLELERGRDSNAALRAALVAEQARYERRVKVYKELVAYNRSMTDKIVAELEGTLGQMKNWASGVDVAATLANIAVSIGKIAGLGWKGAQASGEALEKINKEALKELVDMHKGLAEEGAVKAASTMKDRAGSALGYVGVLADSWDRMTSPSFWAYAAVKKWEGKSWSEAASADVGDEIEQRIREVRSQGAEQEAKLLQQIDECLAAAKVNDKLLRDCETRIAFFEKEAAKLR